MSDELTPEARICVIGGSGVLSREALRAAIGPLIIAAGTRELGTGIRSNEPKPVVNGPMTEIEEWNAAVEQRKAAKKARKDAP